MELSNILLAGLRFYDPQGSPTDKRYTVENIAERRVARTDGLVFQDQPAYLSTILIACYPVLRGPRIDLPFETQLRSGDEAVLLVWRWSSRAHAEEQHERLVQVLKTDLGRAALEEVARVQSCGHDD